MDITGIIYQYLLARSIGRSEVPGREAVLWFCKAAEKGCLPALLNLATVFRLGGLGCDRDLPQSFEWMHKAASIAMKHPEQTYSGACEAGEAQFQLAQYYFRGLGVAHNLVQAFEWFLKGAEAGHPTCCHRVATLYIEGNGVSKSRKKGIQWLKRAAELGVERAKELLNFYE